MVIRRRPVSFALYGLIFVAAALSLAWWLTGGPLRKVAGDVTGGGFANPAVANPAVATDKAVADLQLKLRQNPDNPQGLADLGGVYLEKARETADPSYYTKADEVIQHSLALDPKNFSALMDMGSIALSRHLFRDALNWGEQAIAINPYNSDVYGVVGDAHIELGEYDQAIASFQKMVDLKPGLPAYSRVSYARELHGDVDGALIAMNRAVELGTPGTEGTAWTRVQVGNLYFNRGDLTNAEANYKRSLFDFKDYAHGYAGLAMVAVARGEYATAIKLYTRVTTVLPLPQYVIALGDVQAAAGKKSDAARSYQLVDAEDQLFQVAGVNSDIEIALYNVDHGLKLDTVLGQARQGQADRPSVKGDDVLAWTLYKTGDVAGASDAMQKALRLGWRDPLVLYHAATISYAAGDYAAARKYIDEVMALNPHFSVLYEKDAAQLQDKLKHQSTASGDGFPART